MARSNEILLTVRSSPASKGRRRGRRSAAPDAAPVLTEQLDAAFAENGIEIVGEQETQPTEARRAAVVPDTITYRLPVSDTAPYALAVRHPSGAITFHAPTTDSGGVGRARRGASARRGVAARRELTFDVRSPSTSGGAPGRRGLVSKVVKAVILKVVTPIIDPMTSGRCYSFMERLRTPAPTNL